MTGLPRVVASDCDGTLLRTDGTVSDRTRAALTAITRAGCVLVLVTARPPRWVDPLRDVAGEHGIVLCGNGAFTYDVSAGEVVDHRLIEAALVGELLTELRAALPEVRVATEGLLGFAREEDFERASGRRDGEWLVGTVQQIGSHPAGKILVRHSQWTPDEVHRAVAEVVGDRAEVSHSGTPGLAEIAAPGVSKGLALADWCRKQWVPAAEVWAFGDMPNDLPMLTWAGRSFAVANAHASVLAAATDRTASNDDDGVAQVLEQALATVTT
ncbi:MAG: HAD family hydrolase [Ornithinimicrobium sp.]|uniref:HAD family hydrolase n=1 Tax=Ornithinimicrobium sp. TaxID=1977084 RepID=UPI003D9BB537